MKTLIGAHVSAAGGIENAPVNAHNEECETFQCFIVSPYSYNAPNISDEQVKLFKERCAEYGITRTFVHAPYLVNLASPKNTTRFGSINILRKGLEACSKLGIEGMMFHTGSATGLKDKKEGLKAAIESLNKVLDGYTGTTKLLIENAAGAGATLGVTFTEVGQLFNGIKAKNRKHAGVCMDTQHAFASGYDWRDKKALTAAMKEFASEIGFENLLVIQANDSKTECGSNRDRHEHIGKGNIGIAGFKNLLGHAQLKKVPFVLETEPDERPADIAMLKKLRSK
jgi:deoxyribonuclease-4